MRGVFSMEFIGKIYKVLDGKITNQNEGSLYKNDTPGIKSPGLYPIGIIDGTFYHVGKEEIKKIVGNCICWTMLLSLILFHRILSGIRTYVVI